MSDDEEPTQEVEATQEVDATQETPTEVTPATGAPVPDDREVRRERSYVRVPTWAAIALAAIVLLGGGFALGRATAPDDGNEVSIQVPNREGRLDTPPPRFTGAFLGVDTQAADDPRGVEIVSVRGGSAADEAGLRTGDVITSIDGDEVRDPDSLRALIESHEPGDEVEITYTRDGSSNETTVELGDRASEGSPNN